MAAEQTSDKDIAGIFYLEERLRSIFFYKFASDLIMIREIHHNNKFENCSYHAFFHMK